MVIADLQEGKVNPLDFHLNIKKMEDVIKKIQADPEYMAMVLAEAGKYGKSFERGLAKVEVKEAGSKYDYSKTGDTVYQELEAEETALKAKMKARQQFLQTIPESGTADPETGNMIYRASKSSTTTVAVTLK